MILRTFVAFVVFLCIVSRSMAQNSLSLDELAIRCRTHSTQAVPAVTHTTNPDGKHALLHCMCLGTLMCVGPMCVTGHRNGNKQDVVKGFPHTCISCRCSSLSSSQAKSFPARIWNPSELLYHVHISKTGGTSFENNLRRLATQTGVKMCNVEKPPFTHDPLFAEPFVLHQSGCNIASAEGYLKHVEKQFPFRDPQLLTMLRNPILRTISQWNHDKKYENDRRLISRLKEYSTITEMYEHAPQIPDRFANWQWLKLSRPNEDMDEVLSKFSFIGITEHYETSLCLFYFTYQLHHEFHNCNKRQVNAYNAACWTSNDHEDCKDRNFVNKLNMSEKESEKQFENMIDQIDIQTVYQISEHTEEDMELYKKALHLFWQRVAIMEMVTERRVDGLPQLYRDSVYADETP